jgi:hypothetical protein
MNFDKISTIGKDLVLFLTCPNGFIAINFIGDKYHPNVFAASPRDDEDDDDLDDDDDFYNEEDEDKDNPFDREPTDKEIRDEDFPLGIPEDDLIDDDEEIPYN